MNFINIHSLVQHYDVVFKFEEAKEEVEDYSLSLVGGGLVLRGVFNHCKNHLVRLLVNILSPTSFPIAPLVVVK